MVLSRVLIRVSRGAVPLSSRSFATSARRFNDEKNNFPNERKHPNAEEFAETQKNRPTGPHMTNTTSTIANEMPSVGADKAPPELITAVDPDFVPKDSVPENTERMTGGTQKGSPENGQNADLSVGEMEGVSFKVEPKRRSGEDLNTIRARLLCPSPAMSPSYVPSYF